MSGRSPMSHGAHDRLTRRTGQYGDGRIRRVSKIRTMVGVPAGRRTKYLVLLFWVVVVFVAGPLSGKLTGAEKNDAQSWLPPKAESTQVLALRSKFVSPNVFPAVVVYDRPGGDRKSVVEGKRRGGGGVGGR